jgi:hypothetical protein
VDPAMALFRKASKPTAAAEAPFVIADEPAPLKPQPAAPQTQPATSQPAAPREPQPVRGWRGVLRDGFGLYLGAGGPKYSAVNIDVDTKFLNPLLWLEAFERIWTKVKQPPTPPVPLDATALANVRRETAAIETALHTLRQRRWTRTMGIIFLTMMMPMVLKLISKSLFFPWMCVSMVWMTWPGWNLKGAGRKEKAMRKRLEELYRLEARGKQLSF